MKYWSKTIPWLLEDMLNVAWQVVVLSHLCSDWLNFTNIFYKLSSQETSIFL